MPAVQKLHDDPSAAAEGTAIGVCLHKAFAAVLKSIRAQLLQQRMPPARLLYYSCAGVRKHMGCGHVFKLLRILLFKSVFAKPQAGAFHSVHDLAAPFCFAVVHYRARAAEIVVYNTVGINIPSAACRKLRHSPEILIPNMIGKAHARVSEKSGTENLVAGAVSTTGERAAWTVGSDGAAGVGWDSAGGER